MRETVAIVGVAALILFAGCGSLVGGQDTAAPTQIDASTDRPTADRTVDPTSTATAAPTPSPTPPPEQTPTQPPTPTASPTPSPTPTATDTATASPVEADDPEVAVEGGNLSVDATQVYADVQALLGTDVDPPTVYVREEMPALERYNDQLAADPFYDTFGYGSEFINTSVYHGRASPREVVVMPKNASEPRVKTLLAHEFVHWLQFHSDVADTGGFGGFVDDTDSAQVAAGLVEGASVYVTDAYVERYVDVSWNQTEELRAQYERGPAGRRLFRARYLYGAQYIHSTVESPRNVSWLYDESTPTPVTSEQLIHGETPGEEPELNLTLSVNETGNWTDASNHYDTKGEIVVRTMLRAELNRSVASAAAEGWGSDHVVRLRHGDNRSQLGIAWALRWDEAGEADEFADAFEQWRRARPDDVDDDYRLVRVDDQTVAVFAGDDGFVSNATASGSNDSVTVSAAG